MTLNPFASPAAPGSSQPISGLPRMYSSVSGTNSGASYLQPRSRKQPGAEPVYRDPDDETGGDLDNLESVSQVSIMQQGSSYTGKNSIHYRISPKTDPAGYEEATRLSAEIMSQFKRDTKRYFAHITGDLQRRLYVKSAIESAIDANLLRTRATFRRKNMPYVAKYVNHLLHRTFIVEPDFSKLDPSSPTRAHDMLTPTDPLSIWGSKYGYMQGFNVPYSEKPLGDLKNAHVVKIVVDSVTNNTGYIAGIRFRHGGGHKAYHEGSSIPFPCAASVLPCQPGENHYVSLPGQQNDCPHVACVSDHNVISDTNTKYPNLSADEAAISEGAIIHGTATKTEYDVPITSAVYEYLAAEKPFRTKWGKPNEPFPAAPGEYPVPHFRIPGVIFKFGVSEVIKMMQKRNPIVNLSTISMESELLNYKPHVEEAIKSQHQVHGKVPLDAMVRTVFAVKFTVFYYFRASSNNNQIDASYYFGGEDEINTEDGQYGTDGQQFGETELDDISEEDVSSCELGNDAD